MEIRLMEQIYDVAVIGAGPSGIAAAVYASKHGAKTVLLEKESMIGGTAFRADVHTLKGASYSKHGRSFKWHHNKSLGKRNISS